MNLPRGKSADLPVDNKKTVTLDRNGTLYVDDTPCAIEQFSNDMKALGQSAPNTTILVRADEAIPYGEVVRVLRILHDAKLARMALVTQPDGKSRP